MNEPFSLPLFYYTRDLVLSFRTFAPLAGENYIASPVAWPWPTLAKLKIKKKLKQIKCKMEVKLGGVRTKLWFYEYAEIR